MPPCRPSVTKPPYVNYNLAIWPANWLPWTQNIWQTRHSFIKLVTLLPSQSPILPHEYGSICFNKCDFSFGHWFLSRTLLFQAANPSAYLLVLLFFFWTNPVLQDRFSWRQSFPKSSVMFSFAIEAHLYLRTMENVLLLCPSTFGKKESKFPWAQLSNDLISAGRTCFCPHVDGFWECGICCEQVDQMVAPRSVYLIILLATICDWKTICPQCAERKYCTLGNIFTAK